MRLVHFSDTHLGFRQFSKLTPLGVNQREADVERTFHALIDQVIALAPDLIIIGGDVFHVVRPSNHAIVNAFQEFERLRKGLPSCVIVMVAGNHDTPRQNEQGGLFGLFSSLGIHVVDKTIQRVDFDEMGLSVLGVPETPQCQQELSAMRANGFRLGDLVNPASRYNVMVMHGEIEGMLPNAHGDRSHEISLDTLLPAADAPRWNYVGLGHWHVHREMAPNVYYSGSIDYTSSNPWGEIVEERERGLSGKGFVEHDLETGAHTFHPLAASRPYIDAPTVSVHGMTAADADDAIVQALGSIDGGVDGKAVRLVVTECTRELVHALDQKSLREFKHRALNLNITWRKAEATRIVSSNPANRRQTLEERVTGHIEGLDLPADVDKRLMLARALSALADVLDPYELAERQADGTATPEQLAGAAQLEALLLESLEPPTAPPAESQAA